MRKFLKTGTRNIGATCAIALMLSGCDYFVPQASVPAPVKTASTAAAPVANDPRSLYRLEKVTPVIIEGAQISWFSGGGGSPREVGAFVGKNVIHGLGSQFTGSTPIEMEVRIRQFLPNVDAVQSEANRRHFVRLDFVLRDQATGSILTTAEGLILDIVALNGDTAAVALNAGRTPDVRIAERIQLAADYWAAELTCENTVCSDRPVVVATSTPATPIAEVEEPKAEEENVLENVEAYLKPEPAVTATTPQPAALTPEPAAPAEPQQPLDVAKVEAEGDGANQDAKFYPAPSEPTVQPETDLLRKRPVADPVNPSIDGVVLEIANLAAVWDGEETTGGAWIAMPYIPAYRRAVITNPVNGRTIEANLFWRDPNSGGGSTLLSSEAAAALGVQPGDIAKLGVKILAVE